ncbi:hypothetical protein [[Eubacterium] hominis]|uniref:hypothetical protein n=1 Tax=[Eubacterium] hominis TaxID=2764325 RepID=UPI003A4DC2B6
MKKVIYSFLMLCLCLGITACKGSTDDETIAKETQEKIEKAGWNIDLKRDVGTEIDELDIVISKDDTIRFSRNKKTDNIDSLDFIKETEEDSYALAYIFKEKANYVTSHIVKKVEMLSCIRYPLDDEDKEKDTSAGAQSCSTSEVEEAKAILSQRDDLLSKADIEINEFHTWAIWYYANH